jgi:hypothetical protein
MKAGTRLVLGEVTTRHFRFTVLCSSEAEVRAAFKKAWAIHSRQTGADPDYLTTDTIEITVLPIGVVLRDGSPLKK